MHFSSDTAMRIARHPAARAIAQCAVACLAEAIRSTLLPRVVDKRNQSASCRP